MAGPPAAPQRAGRLSEGWSRPGAELWLDGGHNPAAGQALADALASMPRRPTHLICGMLATKDAAGFLGPMSALVDGLAAVSIPGEEAARPAAEVAAAARGAGMAAREAAGVGDAITAIVAAAPAARILICGSLHLAGWVLRENG